MHGMFHENVLDTKTIELILRIDLEKKKISSSSKNVQFIVYIIVCMQYYVIYAACFILKNS